MIIAGTGHRSNKIGGYSESRFKLLTSFASYVLSQYPNFKELVVISGLALGWDQALAVAALDLNLVVHGYAPCKSMFSNWPLTAQKHYKAIVRRLDSITYVHDGPYPGPHCMLRRSERMVDDCDQLLALWNGDIAKSGTGHCVSYARRKGKPINNVYEQWLEFSL